MKLESFVLYMSHSIEKCEHVNKSFVKHKMDDSTCHVINGGTGSQFE